MPTPKNENDKNDTAEAVETSLDLVKNGDPKTTWVRLSKSARQIDKWSSDVNRTERPRPQAARCKR
jgi:hypothetical protein